MCSSTSACIEEAGAGSSNTLARLEISAVGFATSRGLSQYKRANSGGVQLLGGSAKTGLVYVAMLLISRRQLHIGLGTGPMRFRTGFRPKHLQMC